MTEIAAASTHWMDGYWDEEAAFLRNPEMLELHGVRETVCYALGLLMRDGPGDVDRARTALRSVVGQQLDAPGERFHGTYARAPEEPRPDPSAIEWVHFDPNWRQFVGCALALIVDGFADAVGDELIDQMRTSIQLAVEGEPPDRVHPTYSNIALMRAWLDAWLGVRHKVGKQVRGGEDMARAVADRVAEAGGFDEYNSPTYYGIDLFALALWRGRPPTPLFEELGGRMEAALWLDIAELYHAGLRNLCGPWSRAYGMDMRTYATPLGLYIWQAAGRDAAPFPYPDEDFEHAHDFCFGSLIEHAPTVVPDAAVGHLREFGAPRAVQRTVADRSITAHLEEGAMTGAMGPTGIGWSQLHPATAHWFGPDGELHWLRARSGGEMGAAAGPKALHLEVDTAGVTVEVHPPDAVVSFSRRGKSHDQEDSRVYLFEEGSLDIEVGDQSGRLASFVRSQGS